MKKVLINIINFYQKYISRDHSLWAKKYNKTPHCKYIPSCSQYTKEAIEHKWALKWSLLWFYRILRCMPWSKWWYDPVIKQKKK